MRRLPIFALLAAALLGAGPCLAGSTASAAKTREFHEAYDALERNEPQKAYKILTEFIAKNPAYDAIGLLGEVEIALHKYREAAEHLSLAIRNTPAAKAADAIPVLKEDLAEAKRHLTTLRINVTEAAADVLVDGRSIGRSPVEHEVYLEPGNHTILASHATLGHGDMAIDGKAGEERTINLMLSKASETPGAAPVQGPAANPPASDAARFSMNAPPVLDRNDGIQPKTIVLVVGGAVTALAGGTALVFGLKARNDRDDAHSLSRDAVSRYGASACTNPQDPALCANIREKWDAHDSAAKVFNVMLPVTGVAALATGILYFVWPNRSGSAQHLSLVPVAERNTRGLLLQGGF